MPSGYRGELGERGDNVEWRARGGGETPPAGLKRGEWGGGGAFRGGKVYAW